MTGGLGCGRVYTTVLPVTTAPLRRHMRRCTNEPYLYLFTYKRRGERAYHKFHTDTGQTDRQEPCDELEVELEVERVDVLVTDADDYYQRHHHRRHRRHC